MCMSNTAGDTESTWDLPTTIIRQVAVKTNADTTALKPLYNTIDPDALKALFAAKADGSLRSQGQVVFKYSGCEVTVTSKGDVRAIPLDDH
jgi:hypothetical protein